MKSPRLFFLAAVSLLFSASSLPAAGQSTAKQETNEWTKAETAIAEHLKKIDPNMRSAIFSSNLLRKYLPDFRVYVRVDSPRFSQPTIFLVNRGGEITPLPSELWRGEDGEKFLRSPEVAEFIRQRKIKVQSAEEAVDFVKLFEEVQGAASYVASLNINTKDFKVFDKAFIESYYGPTNWKYSAKKSNEGWSVGKHYAGPPEASIEMPPVYEIVLDGQKTFLDLRRSN